MELTTTEEITAMTRNVASSTPLAAPPQHQPRNWSQFAYSMSEDEDHIEIALVDCSLLVQDDQPVVRVLVVSRDPSVGDGDGEQPARHVAWLETRVLDNPYETLLRRTEGTVPEPVELLADTAPPVTTFADLVMSARRAEQRIGELLAAGHDGVIAHFLAAAA